MKRWCANLPTVPALIQYKPERTEALRAVAIASRVQGRPLSGGAESQDFPTTPEAAFPNFLGGPSDGFLARLPLALGPMVPLEAKGVGGGERPTIAPLVTYVGDELRNFGLDVLVVTLDDAIGLAAEPAKGLQLPAILQP